MTPTAEPIMMGSRRTQAWMETWEWWGPRLRRPLLRPFINLNGRAWLVEHGLAPEEWEGIFPRGPATDYDRLGAFLEARRRRSRLFGKVESEYLQRLAGVAS